MVANAHGTGNPPCKLGMGVFHDEAMTGQRQHLGIIEVIAERQATLGGDFEARHQALEGGAAFKAARALVERLSGGEELDIHFNDYVADGFS